MKSICKPLGNQVWRNSIKRAAILVWGLAMMAAPQVRADMIKTDIVMLVDETGSMSDVYANLKEGMSAFASILQAGGVDAQFALVGYGSVLGPMRVLTDFTDEIGLAEATDLLVPVGRTEPIYDAIGYALDELSFAAAGLSYRSDALKNMILFADEASNSDVEESYSSVSGLLSDYSVLFNVVIDSSITELIDLALNNSGNVFDLAELSSSDAAVVSEFIDTFAETKLAETLDYCRDNPEHAACADGDPNPVPAPLTLGLLLLGVSLVSTKQKRELSSLGKRAL